MKSEIYALFRTAKLKDKVSSSLLSDERTVPQQIEATEGHELRLFEVPNADPSRWTLNRLLIDGLDLGFIEAREKGYLRPGLFRERVIEAAADKGVSKESIPDDAVLAQQLLLSASAEYFSREKVGGELRAVLDDKYTRWRAATIDFVRQKYGPNLLFLVEHLDEVTPHITAYVVPLVYKADKPRGKWGIGLPPQAPTWRLAAADLFGRRQLRDFWTEYAQATADLGMVRPPENSRVSYQTMGRLYAAVAEAESKASVVDTTRWFEIPPPRSGAIPEFATSYATRVAAALKASAAEAKTLIDTLHLEAADAQRNRKRLRELNRALREEQKRRKKLEEDLQKEREHRQSLEALRRDVFCDDIFKTLKIPSIVRGDEIHGETKVGHKIVFQQRDFKLTHPTGEIDRGTGVVELLQHLFKLSVQQAEQLCIHLIGGPAIGAITSRLIRQVGGRVPNREVAIQFAQKLSPSTPTATNEMHPDGAGEKRREQGMDRD